jgi:magnesium chelatase accessory protein
LSWAVDGETWPHREASRFIKSGALEWHVQVSGKGPVLLLLHGTGASTHSWRDTMSQLSKQFTVIVPDLPGHGFTTLPDGSAMSLPGMAQAVTLLLRDMDVTPDLVAGHSAGAAIALRMCLDGEISPKALVSLNGALMPFPGLAAVAFPTMAKALFLNPMSVPIAAHFAGEPENIRSVISRTGTDLPEEGLAYYARLFQDRRHVAAAINMMARWDLNAFQKDLRDMSIPVTLVSGAHDMAVPLWVAREVKDKMPSAEIVVLPDCGHLAHEEHPNEICDLLIERARAAAVLPEQ